MVEYDDLSEEQARQLPSLKITDSSKFSQGLIPAIPKVQLEGSAVWDQCVYDLTGTKKKKTTKEVLSHSPPEARGMSVFISTYFG